MGADPDPPDGSLEAIGFRGGVDWPGGPRRPERKRGAVWAAGILAVVAGTAAAIVAVAFPGGAAKTAAGGPAGAAGSAAAARPGGAARPAGSGSPGQDAKQVATAFLLAWQRGDLAQAAGYTSSPVAARAALAAYRADLHLRKLSTQVRAVTAAGDARENVLYAVSATVALSADPRALSGGWAYTASLVAFRQPGSGAWSIDWTPDVLAPGLAGAAAVLTVGVSPAAPGVTDASGTGLATYSDAGLTTIAGDLRGQAQAGIRRGTPGLAVELQAGDGNPVPGSAAVVVAPRAGPGLATTIDGRAEAAARGAVSRYANSSMVAIQPTTGKILAIANTGGDDDALRARVAPGSTMKVITSAALFDEGVLTASSEVACPRSYTVQGITYHNANDEALPDGTTFTTDFALSCNNAFSSQWPHLTGLLAGTAQTYFGLNQAWYIGIPGQPVGYFNAPADASGSELAQEAFGEGKLLASPLAMASVAATVDTGTFRQPYLLPGTPRVTASPLPAGTASQLQEMMRAVVTSGTAAALGFGPDVYAKTGTADVAGQGQPNSWLIAFDPGKDVAVACLVLDAGFGAQYAGPEVKAFLSDY